MKTFTVFYAGMIHLETDDIRAIRMNSLGIEVYNGAYVYVSPPVDQWLRADHTPVLREDVPKELRALMLIMS